MPDLTRRRLLALSVLPLGLAACGRRDRDAETSRAALEPGSPELRALVDDYADAYDIPRSLMHRVVKRESNYNPAARNGPYYGLMQIHPQTAATMGFDGAPADLLDAETNLKYAGKYLRGAWLVADGSEDRAVKWYSSGYYYEAKRKGLLEETGLQG
jgi:soluble lytic murein transglycosylase-like protein